MSASGSRNAPERVVPCPAGEPAVDPVGPATSAPTATVHQLAPRLAISAMKSGVARSRATVSALAGVASAEGPNGWPAVSVTGTAREERQRGRGDEVDTERLDDRHLVDRA